MAAASVGLGLTSVASALFSYGLFGIKNGDIDYRRVLSPPARKDTQKAPPHPIHEDQFGDTASPNTFFFDELCVGADMAHGFCTDYKFKYHSPIIRKIDTSTDTYDYDDPLYLGNMIGIEPFSMYCDQNDIVAAKSIYHMPPKLSGGAPCPSSHQQERISTQNVHSIGMPYDSGGKATALEHFASDISDTPDQQYMPYWQVGGKRKARNLWARRLGQEGIPLDSHQRACGSHGHRAA